VPHLAVPPGLEAVAAAEAVERGLAVPVKVRDGVLACAPGTPYESLFPALRCIYTAQFPLATGPALGPPGGDLPRRIRALLEQGSALSRWREWIDSPDGLLRYRFSLSGPRIPRPALRAVLEEVRAVLRPLGLEDSPSAYAVELQVESARDAAHLLLTPSFVPDDRFGYRAEDVGASIHPVVGACLARLVRATGTSVVVDPTCGSGTLLVERLRLDDEVRGRGMDVSPTAVRVARGNLRVAGLDGRTEVVRGDSAGPEAWPECDEVLANLPFGVRTRRGAPDNAQLYSGLVGNLVRALRPGGRALLYTSDRAALNAALSRHGRKLNVDKTLVTRSGGLDVGIWLLHRT
jgi:23S rRNA G2445 N2-methylase RlmL